MILYGKWDGPGRGNEKKRVSSRVLHGYKRLRASLMDRYYALIERLTGIHPSDE